MSQNLIAELIGYCNREFGVELTPTSGPRDLLAAELGLLKSLVRLGRAAMQHWCQQLGDGDRGARITEDGVSYRRLGKRAKTIHGLFGWVSYVRVCYARLGGGAGWAPLDDQLGAQRGYTSGCQYFMACFCGRQPYQESLDHFHEVFRADDQEKVSMRKAYQMTCAVNHGLEQQRQQEITEYLEEGTRVAVQEPITDTMAVCIDAGKVPTRANENVDDAGAKSYQCQYRDAKVATVSALHKPKDADTPAAEAEEDTEEAVRLTNTSCVTGIEHADAFFARIEVEMQRRSAQLAALNLVIIADGASWIWDRVADLAERGQQVWHILDFWHACEHLATIARWLYGEGSERCTESFRRWRGMLRESRGAEVIEELTTLRDSGEYPALRADIQGEVDYLMANQQRMDYRRYRELGLPIGSGTVESACKNVVAARMKQSGMMWGMPGATGMLQLRASLKSRRFRSDHERLLPFSPPQETERMAA